VAAIGSFTLFVNGDRTKGLTHDANGGLTLHESNCLPAPDGKYSLVARIYGPSQAATDGTWKLPGLIPVAEGK
jgi:hypothetical protein